MKKEDFLRFMEGKMDDLINTSREGQKEYAHGVVDNCFNNFLRGAEEVDIHPMKVLWVLAIKHKDGIGAWMKGHHSQREPVQGRIKDMIVYLFILWAWVDTREGSWPGETLELEETVEDKALPF